MITIQKQMQYYALNILIFGITVKYQSWSFIRQMFMTKWKFRVYEEGYLTTI